jgi:hypothetical protein
MSHKNYRKETNCLNCGAEVTGKFCSNCGQENIETKENFFHLAFHFISDIFHFDSKFFGSLIPLFTRPGFLTKEYWDGRRVKYIHPLRLFFFASILFVLASGSFYKHFDKELKSVFQPDSVLAKIDTSVIAKLPDSVKISLGTGRDSITVKQAKEAKTREARQLRKLGIGTDHVFKSIKYVTFFLLPLYALIFKLLYIRRKLFYVDHLVYMMHLQSFIYTIMTVIFLLPLFLPIPLDFVRLSIVLITFIYVSVSLWYLYHQPWWKTILKSLIATFLLFMTTVILVFGIAALDAIFIQ